MEPRASTQHLRVQKASLSYASQPCVKMLMKGVVIRENFTIEMEFTLGGSASSPRLHIHPSRAAIQRRDPLCPPPSPWPFPDLLQLLLQKLFLCC